MRLFEILLLLISHEGEPMLHMLSTLGHREEDSLQDNHTLLTSSYLLFIDQIFDPTTKGLIPW
jgi:hypothetical protein